MSKLIITDNSSEKLEIISDGERYAIITQTKLTGAIGVTVLNPAEALTIAEFIYSQERVTQFIVRKGRGNG